MKPGDKVWWFDARTQTIECSIVCNTNERGNIVFTYTLALVVGHDGFPTREALCEHYRKIFE